MTYLQARGCILLASSPEILACAKKVTGESLDHLTSWDALHAALPVGTVSGVPKGRYTLIGAQLAVEFVAKENFVTVIDGWEGSRREEFVEDPMCLLKRMMEKWKPQPKVELPDTFCGGWFGYFYDTFRYVEKKLPFSSAPMPPRY
ncbi:anthranilate synthase alpha subunit 2, chloroplastic-like [Rhododendron vialii]|uniref:anthranilate synthase alpha subunit 2, chloroplastic-like n=1 Tax=Rhododendron vialii TaxID=182163 RepID=UPI00265F5965|nr:anthranilate synthase alpha subunit 2, chloroplastic-like [Rhododendron vialii]XP_058227492.1 anthranilate synthase alpha subunit 2, chloroplastic-like [Rhododendron vialii]